MLSIVWKKISFINNQKRRETIMDLKKHVGPGRAPVTGNERLVRLLNAVLWSDGELRVAAEQATQKLEALEDYPVMLTEIVLNPNWCRDVRIFASTRLKKYVRTHWPTMDENFRPLEINKKKMTKVRELLLNGLCENSIEVQSVVADLIGSIAPWNWLDNWPELMDTLVSCLNGEGYLIHGALLVLEQFEIDERVDPKLGDLATILREVNRIFAGDYYSKDIRCTACSVMRKMISEIAYEEQPDIIRDYLRPAIVPFCKTMLLSWTSRNCSNELKVDILSALVVYMECVPKYIADFLVDMLPVILETLIECAKDYQAYVVNRQDKQGGDAEIESDDMATGNYSDALMDSFFEFFEHLMNAEERYSLCIPDCKLSREEWCQLQDSFSTPQVLRHLIMLMEVTDTQIRAWETVVDFFVKKEEVHSFRNNDNLQLGQVLIENVRRHKGAGANRLTMVIMKYLEEENEMRINGRSGVHPGSWKSHEAFLNAFALMKDCIISTKNGSSSCYDVVPFLENIVFADLNNPASHPLLVGRCLILGGLYSRQLPKKLASAFLEATIKGLEWSRPILVKICAACAISLWYYRDSSGNIKDDKMLQSHVPVLSEGLFDLVENFQYAGVHKIVLRGIVSLMPYNEAFTASITKKIYSLAIKALFKYRVIDMTHEWPFVFKELAMNAKCIPLLQNRLARHLLAIMTGTPPGKPENGHVVLKIVTVLVKHSPLPLSHFLIDTLFFKACNFISSTDDHDRFPAGIKLMHTYISVAPDEVLFRQDENGKYGAQYVLQVIVHALRTMILQDDTTVEEACQTLILLTTKSWHQIKENVDELLQTLLRCMQNQAFTPVIQQLLMVFAHLICNWSDAFFELLAAIPSCAERKSSLECIISKGFCKYYRQIVGKERKTMSLAFGKILGHAVKNPSSPLHEITVKDRSVREIPVLAKICQLVVDYPPSETDDQN